MSDPLHAYPVVCEQTLRALARYPSRTAFSLAGRIAHLCRRRPN